jgi:SSS family solute:Na+ symporter
MISFNAADYIVILAFFTVILLIGYFAARFTKEEGEDYLLGGRNVGLLMFILTNVATWYGGILGVGEFTYNYGLASWFTQGIPYYAFAFLFAFLFAEKIRKASLFTIPDKITQVYGRTAGLLSAVVVFILVSPAPYLLMVANLISLVFNISLFYSLIISNLLVLVFMIKGGFRSDIFTDAFEFFVMFGGFIVILLFAVSAYGGFGFLKANLPPAHLTPTGGASPVYIIVWFFIALWTFADPGFHQRCYAAKDGKTARNGILISIILWAFFDFLTTSTGLYARAAFPNLANPSQSYLFLAEKLLGPGLKGFFYIALFATILSTLNSFLFISATTIGRDFFQALSSDKNDGRLKKHTGIGLIISSVLSILFALLIPSVIGLWYTIGSLFIPAIIFLVTGAYFPKFRVSSKYAVAEMIAAVFASASWLFIKDLSFIPPLLKEVEPMITGLVLGLIIHCVGVSQLRLKTRN